MIYIQTVLMTVFLLAVVSYAELHNRLAQFDYLVTGEQKTNLTSPIVKRLMRTVVVLLVTGIALLVTVIV